jgi:spore coat polysaccharide biosynthesis protein SpsF (cytidylyltransferase family)
MSLFEIGNYVIINDLYLGRIIKKIWNGLGTIVKLDNDNNYMDSTIVQYMLLSDVISGPDVRGYKLVNSNDKMRVVNKNNLFELVEKDLQKEKFIYIDDKITNNYNYFLQSVLPTLYMNITGNILNTQIYIVI